MIRRETLATVAVALVVLTSIVSPVQSLESGSVTALDESSLSVTLESVTPDEPSVAEPTKFNLSIESRYKNAKIERIKIVDAKSDETYRNVGYGRGLNVEQGQRIVVPVTTTFDRAGPKNLKIRVVMSDDSQQETISIYETISVHDGRPLVNVNTSDTLVENHESTVNVTVSNVEPHVLRRVTLSLSGPNVNFEDSKQAISTLGVGETHSFEFAATPESSGNHEIRANLSVATDTGYMTTSESLNVRVEPPRTSVALDESINYSGDSPEVGVRLTNDGNTDVENLIVRANDSGDVLNRAYVDELKVDGTASKTLDLTGASSDVTLEVAYDSGTGQQVTSELIPYSEISGEIILTSVDVTEESGTLEISGHASNVGPMDAESVTVRVRSTENVTPAQPSKQYFIGNLESSGFVSFDLYATASGTTSIPVEITYLQNGVERTSVQQVQIQSDAARASSSSSGGTSLVLVFAGVVGVVALGGIGIGLYRTV